MTSTEEEEIPSLKDLASSVPRLRRTALTEITAHLSSRGTPLTPTQCLQLWRGFFVALYMHDSKSPVSVQNLIAELAGLFGVLAEMDNRDDGTGQGEEKRRGRGQEKSEQQQAASTTVMFANAFWETMAREWSGVDVHRMNKILLLIRVVTRRIFSLCLLDDPEDGGIASLATRMVETKGQCEVFERWPLSPRERKVPDGLRYHVLDIWVDELQLVSGQAGEDGKSFVKRFMEPVEKLAKEGLTKPVRVRAKETSAAAEEMFVGEEKEAGS